VVGSVPVGLERTGFSRREHVFTFNLLLIKYKQKWERAVKKRDERDEMRESDEDE
jgi:hypothetical protein